MKQERSQAPRRVWLLAVLLLPAAGCQKSDSDSVTKKVAYNGPIVETNNVLMLISDSARLRIRLTSPLEQQFENGNIVYPKGVRLTSLAADGRTVASTIVGNYGKFEKEKNLYTLRGNVQVTNEQKQQTLSTEEAFFDKQKAQIYTQKDVAVRVTTPTEVLTGRGLTANQDFSRYSILTPTGIFTLQNAPAPDAPAR
ncbi:LPS export ABC transporter periplasmic protein LptC [Hymenobacter weizhouensis]|uniref:LPS export ABC transporter periplasmic protein LptC n=1 Tax=Hymenobacter sp. YIM 151500-1 TaxID=2987689 RepID=UPI002227DD65|nr:LPS export ABC transporter periplasmic protein LptC [Hymenobacter sp. YIM 151500-1]UYZ62218.1 LPS export ABC transporter periplasmic protein LptC [Hymenobacter sp. YIM 151500-1]